ncbi:MAG: DNA-3-methyladenine glycosylase I [Chloroflexota bacterium]|nr:DNA-3-methyladenine glycosylase I [Chloroflexota bacterium]
MEAPPQIKPRSIDDYLEQLSKSVFQAGISWRVVDAKWSTIKPAFRGFQVERVARMGDREIDALASDPRVIRSRPKIAAVVHNARAILELERDGGFRKHLRSFDDYEDLATDLKKRFKFVGDSGTYHFLWTVSHAVPDWHVWAKAHGISWGDEAAAPKKSTPKKAAPKKKAARVTRPRR